MIPVPMVPSNITYNNIINRYDSTRYIIDDENNLNLPIDINVYEIREETSHKRLVFVAPSRYSVIQSRERI
jgi:hypothetical protein